MSSNGQVAVLSARDVARDETRISFETLSGQLRELEPLAQMLLLAQAYGLEGFTPRRANNSREQDDGGVLSHHASGARLHRASYESLSSPLLSKNTSRKKLATSASWKSFARKLPKCIVPQSPWSIWGYKLVAKVGDKYFSLRSGEDVEYAIGSSVEEEARPDRRGGLYICDSPASALSQYIETRFADGLAVTLLRCSCVGPFVDYGGGKAACSELTPIEEVQIPSRDVPIGPTPGLWQRLHATGTFSTPPSGSHFCKDRRMRAMPGWALVGFTLVARMGKPPLGDRYFSLWTVEAFRYELGEVVSDTTLTEPSQDHLWVVRALEDAERVPISIAEKMRSSGIGSAPRTLLRCICDGPFVEHADGRIACTKLTPLDEVALPNSQVFSWQAATFVPAAPQQARPPRTPRMRAATVQRALRTATAQRVEPQSRPASAPFHGRRACLVQRN